MKWAYRHCSRSAALMQWYPNKKFVPLALKNCHMPLALGNCYSVCSPDEQSQFTHFFFFFCRSAYVSSGISGVTCLFLRHLSPPRMFSFPSCKKGPSQMIGFSPLFLWGTLWIRHCNLDAPWWSSGQSPSVSIGQSHESTGHISSRWNTYRVSLHKQSHFASLCCQRSGGQVLAKSQTFTHSISARLHH